MGLNVRVFLEVTIGAKTGGRVVFELFHDVVSRTVHNFVSFCTGEYGKAKHSGLSLCYKGCSIFKVVPGVMIQSGDFEHNDGTGGESVFGGVIPMESTLRRHSQAGVLSMITNDAKRVGSQFIVTLRRAPQFDGKSVVIGQVVEGMDILRAIEKCPIDGNNCPRVPIVIVDCGIQKRPQGMRYNDPRREMREAVDFLMSSLNSNTEPQPKKISEAQRGLQKLQEVLKQSQLEKPLVSESSLSAISTDKVVCSQPSSQDSNSLASQNKIFEFPLPSSIPAPLEYEPDLVPPVNGMPSFQNDYKKKLYQIRQRLDEGRHLNAKEVALEKQKKMDKKSDEAFWDQKKIIQEIVEATCPPSEASQRDVEYKATEENAFSSSSSRKKGKKGQWSNDDSADWIQWKDDLIKKKQANAAKAFGWDAINAHASFKAHKKRTAGLTLQPEIYAKQMLELGETFYDPTTTLVSKTFTPTEEAKSRFVASIEKDKAKRNSFSRRRKYVEAETVAYVNDFNRSFNQKLERAYGVYSAEIRQNLERGTAL